METLKMGLEMGMLGWKTTPVAGLETGLREEEVHRADRAGLDTSNREAEFKVLGRYCSFTAENTAGERGCVPVG